MHSIDWVIVSGILVLLIAAANYTKRYNQSVADFLVANRCAGRYLLAVAGNMANFGAISILAWYEMFYEGGFGAVWWHTLMYSVPIIIGVSGWLIYRYRQTRVMTLAQFFEIRYSKNFRVFSGILCFTSGILNFGIFPAVGARFFIYFCGLPETVTLSGFEVATFPLLLIILLSISLYFTFAGGLITVIVTDFNMDKMLHRGKYADESAPVKNRTSRFALLEKLGIEKTFSRQDKLAYAACIGWPLLVFGVFIVGTIYNTLINKNVSDQAWLQYWAIWLIVSLSVVVLLMVWFMIGGLKNLIDLFRRLRIAERDTGDDGTVAANPDLIE